MGLGAAGKIAEFNAFRDGLSPWDQIRFEELSLLEQTRLADLATLMDLPPDAVGFYLEQTARPGSPLTNLPLADALRVSALAAESGRGAFILDYIGRYGVTDALKIASPEVIRGMTNDQFLVRAQNILRQDAGYNVTPEYVFADYPGSTIGLKSTFITDESAISDIIGNFHRAKTIYVSLNQAIALETALGLKPGTLIDGFRISKISNLNSLDLSYPLKGTEPLFLGPGKGLPGGGTEITINPPVLMDSPNVVDQITVKVHP
jgi:hypothetical protein